MLRLYRSRARRREGRVANFAERCAGRLARSQVYHLALDTLKISTSTDNPPEIIILPLKRESVECLSYFFTTVQERACAARKLRC
jgi:hypothetical protein